MKNIHIIPTDKPSRLHYSKVKSDESISYKLVLNQELSKCNDGLLSGQRNICITSDEVPKLDEWGINTKNNVVFKCKGFTPDEYDKKYCKKITLTTNPDLIKDGVQAINDKFLEWFIANPSCEEVEVEKLKCTGQCWKFIESDYKKTCLSGCELKEYKIIIPQETLEEFIKSQPYYGYCTTEYKEGIEVGAKWQAQRMYSEEDMISFATWLSSLSFNLQHFNEEGLKSFNELFPIWFDQFKKK
jgi:hypothetical protein